MNHTVRYLQELCNKYGDFFVAKVWMRNGKKRWSKWRSVMDCWHSEKGLKFLEQVNNRTLLNCEIVIDIEEKNLDAVKRALYLLKKCLNIPSCNCKIYDSGSRGYHIHCIDERIAADKKFRKELRKSTIFFLQHDLALIIDKHMIAIENVPHWKTGNVKKEINY